MSNGQFRRRVLHSRKAAWQAADVAALSNSIVGTVNSGSALGRKETCSRSQHNSTATGDKVNVNIVQWATGRAQLGKLLCSQLDSLYYDCDLFILVRSHDSRARTRLNYILKFTLHYSKHSNFKFNSQFTPVEDTVF